MRAFGYLLLLWALISLSVYAYRGYRRLAKGPKAARDATPTTAASSTTLPPFVPPPTTPRATIPPAPPTSPEVAAPPVQPGAPPPPSATDGAVPSASPAAPRPAVPFARLPGHAPSEPAPPDAGGSFAAAAAGAAPAPAGAGRVPVAQALEGITMPCDLAPLMTFDAAPDPFRIAFSTTGYSPADVGAGLGAELERLGFSLSTVSDIQVLATKGDTSVTVTLVANAAALTNEAGDHLYPTVPNDAVVVELRT